MELVGEADALLAKNKVAAKRQWAGLEEDALAEEIGAYRNTIRKVEAQLVEMGDTIFAESRQRNQSAEASGAEEYAHLGQEGVDFQFGSVDDLDPSEWQVPPHCIPIHANVTTYNWKELYEHTQFDVIMMDPPWQLATANPTRGVALGYSQLTDRHITDLPVPKLQSNGLLFVWVINAKYKFTLDLFEKWGYE